MSILPFFQKVTSQKTMATAISPMIDLRNVHKYYKSAAGDYHALKDIDLCILCG